MIKMENVFRECNDQDVVEYFKDKTVLITGGAGSIGKALVKKLLNIGTKKVRVLDINENELASLRRKFSSHSLEIFLGDVRDISCVKDAVAGVDIVFHAAALKHVPLSEYYSIEYVKTNVMGTQNVIDSSMDENVKKVILISTDKAVNPINVMGATKLLAEKLIIAANVSPRNKGTIFSCVRFGNVLYTRESVLEIFLTQLKSGSPLTITDPNMTRFIIDIEKATKLILKAAYYSKKGEVFILNMKAVKLSDLAQAFIEVFAPKFGFNPSQIKIKIIGKRPGEKMHEEIMTEHEAERVIKIGDMFVIIPELIGQNLFQTEKIEPLTSKNAELATVDEIKKMLENFFNFMEIDQIE
jgi:FlaA1/EpsC-like NDP-sugar epimerase